MELRHLDTLLAIDEAGSFTGAADALATVQSNVSEHVRRLEEELGAPLLLRGRRGAQPTEFGVVVLERARRVRRELEAMKADLSMLQGLETGYASFGIVGTASRWMVPALVADLRARAPGVHLRITEGASERLATKLLDRELAQAVVTEPMTDPRLVVEHLLEETMVGVVDRDVDLGPEPVELARLAGIPMILPPPANPLRAEIEAAARAAGVELSVPLEVEGIRLIADLVAAGAGASVLPETAVPSQMPELRAVRLVDLPPRRLALISARDAHLSLADRAARDAVRRLIAAHLAERTSG